MSQYKIVYTVKFIKVGIVFLTTNSIISDTVGLQKSHHSRECLSRNLENIFKQTNCCQFYQNVW